MCAPCKVVINGGASAAAERASTIRSFLLLEKAGNLPPHELGEDEELYQLALSEVEFVEAVRKAGVALAKRVGAPERWRLLMERL